MQIAHRVLPAVALALLSTSSLAQTTTYTTSAGFLSQLAPGSYTENFNALVNPLPEGPASFSGGGFSYTVSAAGDLYASGEFLSTSLPDEALTITFTSGNVTALGANFFAVNLSDEFQPVAITLTLSDGTVETFTPGSLLDSYRGFTSTLAITSLVVSGPGTSLYAGLDNLTIGSVVPEPGSWLLMGLGVAALLVHRRRNA